MKKRDANIELLRIFACVMVIFLHTWKGSGLDEISLTVKGVIRVFEQQGVPIFMLIMGYFLFDGTKAYGQKVKESIIKILIPAFVIMLISQVLYPWVINEETLLECITHIRIDAQNLFGNILNWSAGMYLCDHLWYIYKYMEIIILLPLLMLICKEDSSSDKIRRGYILFSILICVMRNGSYLIKQLLELDFSWNWYSPFDICVTYVLIGYELRRMYKDGRKSVSPLILVLVYFGCLFAVCAEELICSLLHVPNQYYLMQSVFHIGAAVSIFLLFQICSINNEFVRNTICYIADKTYYIYLIHYFFVTILGTKNLAEGIANVPSILRYIICVLGIFMVSLFIAVIWREAERLFRRRIV